MLKQTLFILCISYFQSATSQTRCVVADMETRLPLRGVRAHADNNREIETDYTGTLLLGDFKTLTLAAFGYMRRIVHRSELTDTIFLLPTMLREVVIYGNAPKPGFDLKKSIKQSTAGVSKSSAGMSFDFFSIFDRSRRRPSKREREMTEKILKNY